MKGTWQCLQNRALITKEETHSLLPLCCTDICRFAAAQVGDATVAFRPEWDRHRLTPRHTAYLRVAEGCSHACTFCAIPGFR